MSEWNQLMQRFELIEARLSMVERHLYSFLPEPPEEDPRQEPIDFCTEWGKEVKPK